MPGKMSLQIIRSASALTSEIVLRTFFEKFVESVSLYDPVMTFKVWSRPRAHSTKQLIVRDFP